MRNDGASPAREVARFTVEQQPSGGWRVCEHGFAKAVAEFDDRDTAEQYALRLAETKADWKVDVCDASGTLLDTYNSEDDAMPRVSGTGD